MENNGQSFLKRKSNRLQNYDYSTEGLYFITICTEGKKKSLGSVVGGDLIQPPVMKYSPIGEIVAQQIQTINRSDCVSVEKYVVMPNHIHLLLLVNMNEKINYSAANMIIPHTVGTFKRFCNQRAGCQIFQRSFHDHVIRGKADFEKIWKYIEDNPRRWKEDCYYSEE